MFFCRGKSNRNSWCFRSEELYSPAWTNYEYCSCLRLLWKWDRPKTISLRPKNKRALKTRNKSDRHLFITWIPRKVFPIFEMTVSTWLSVSLLSLWDKLWMFVSFSFTKNMWSKSTSRFIRDRWLLWRVTVVFIYHQTKELNQKWLLLKLVRSLLGPFCRLVLRTWNKRIFWKFCSGKATEAEACICASSIYLPRIGSTISGLLCKEVACRFGDIQWPISLICWSEPGEPPATIDYPNEFPML